MAEAIGWLSGSGAAIVNTANTYGNTSVCTHDGRTIVPLPNTGTNVARLTGTGVTSGSTNIWTQTLPVFAQFTKSCPARHIAFSGCDGHHRFFNLSGA